jgi:hypothetical protein
MVIQIQALRSIMSYRLVSRRAGEAERKKQVLRLLQYQEIHGSPKQADDRFRMTVKQ